MDPATLALAVTIYGDSLLTPICVPYNYALAGARVVDLTRIVAERPPKTAAAAVMIFTNDVLYKTPMRSARTQYRAVVYYLTQRAAPVYCLTVPRMRAGPTVNYYLGDTTQTDLDELVNRYAEMQRSIAKDFGCVVVDTNRLLNIDDDLRPTPDDIHLSDGGIAKVTRALQP